MNVVIRRRPDLDPGRQQIEVVERKGLGHPDTICDALSEAVSQTLSQYYLAQFGEILHYNVDKILLVGGSSEPCLGGGRITTPAEIFIAGRATIDWEGLSIPVADIARAAASRWLHAHLRPEFAEHVRITPLIRQGSTDLRSLFANRRGPALSNDTSCGSGFAPLSSTEQLVLAIETTLNGAEVKRVHPAIGEDIKVMAVRQRDRVMLTIGCAMVSQHVRTSDEYVAQREAVREIATTVSRVIAPKLDVTTTVNAADDDVTGRHYLTVAGTSAEAGDDGETGRGNRTSGLITPYRAMTLEAAAGKNPVTHVGKLYQLLATDVAAGVAGIPGAHGAECVMVSQIGRPVCDPLVVDISIDDSSGTSDADIREVVSQVIANGDALTGDLIAGTRRIF